MSEYLDKNQVIELYDKYRPSLANHVYEYGSIMKCSKCGEEVCCKDNNFCSNCGRTMKKEGGNK